MVLMKKLILLAIIAISVCATTFAQEVSKPAETTTAPATSSKPRIDIGAGYWYTGGSLDLKLFADGLVDYWRKKAIRFLN